MIPEAADGVQTPKGLDLVTHLDPKAPASEAFRELRTGILLSHAGEPPRQLMVTSAVPEEGKSTTSLNLAVTLAQLGQRVLIVDTDLRRPRLHKVFGMANEVGASTFLSGLEDDAAGLTMHTPIPNLDIMSSGPVPPNPSELLNSPRFNELGRELLAAGYEHILYDSPPLLAVSDPVIIASRVETAIIVVRAGKTTRQSIRVAVEKMRQTGKGRGGDRAQRRRPGRVRRQPLRVLRRGRLGLGANPNSASAVSRDCARGPDSTDDGRAAGVGPFVATCVGGAVRRAARSRPT